ncbi:prepilin peptidase [Thalassomonas sp. M1454]|uniref:prepilin peptidase n=1 Tax=Thalassomonas sp. M1454 TaxID=2594477 RepID=UPI00117DFD0B|nr:A24 family peptidase [Thalassomonas sp. M1454]TRX52850.1 prepilin peptidase [Thalassomonas sp. M1454]
MALFEQSPSMFYTTITILGLVIGSFLNVVIYRLPKMMENEWFCECRELLADELKPVDKKQNKAKQEKEPEALTLSKPASTCPKCGHKIKILENIPVLSWLFLKGKCSNCSNPISARYPIIETVSGILSLVIAMHYGVTIQTLFMLILTWSLITLTMIDFDKMILPDQITLPLVWLGLLLNLNGVFIGLEQAVVGAMVGYLSLWSIFWLFKLVTGKEGMGYGDFKLFAVFGAWFGWELLPVLILMASLVGAVIGISLMVFKNHEGSKPIPFGPYLAIAGWITALWGDSIWQWYLGMLV